MNDIGKKPDFGWVFWTILACVLALVIVVGLKFFNRASVSTNPSHYSAGGLLTESTSGFFDRDMARQKAEWKAEKSWIEKNLRESETALFADKRDLVLGNPAGAFNLVIFFDYNNWRQQKWLQNLLAREKEVRVVMKELPRLRYVSVLASRAALAAKTQGKYEDLFWQLLAYKGKLTEEEIFRLALDQGLKIEQLRQDMDSPEIANHLAQNEKLAQMLLIKDSTAIFVQDGEVRRTSASDLKELLAAKQSTVSGGGQ